MEAQSAAAAPRVGDDGGLDRATVAEFVYENMLVSRLAAQGVAPFRRDDALDRSATLLLARLEAQGPMTVAELSAAFGLDVSTVHRQVAAAMRAGLIERLADPEGGQAKVHRPTAVGSARLADELAARGTAAAQVLEGFSQDELETYVRLMRRFNEGVERVREQPWPRP